MYAKTNYFVGWLQVHSLHIHLYSCHSVDYFLTCVFISRKPEINILGSLINHSKRNLSLDNISNFSYYTDIGSRIYVM